MTVADAPILAVENLVTEFRTGGGWHPAVRDVSFAVQHNETLALVDGTAFETPSTKQAKALVESWGKETPLVVVAHEDEIGLIKSFRNLDRVLVTVPSELEVAPIVWARSVLVSEAALPLVEGKAS